MLDLSGKVALVTGGSRGIGRATCLKLASYGTDIAVNYSGSDESAAAVVAELTELGRRATAVKADVSDGKSVQEMIDRTVAEMGNLHILINNAGINRDALLLRLKEDDWDGVIATNLKGTFNCIQAAARVMIKNRAGAIVNLSSVVALTGNIGQANYTAAKAGIIGLTKSAAKELAPRGIRVNAVAPGFIETDMTAALSEEIKLKVAAKIPLGGFGMPEDVANLIAFLVSDEASYITGQTIIIDGGLAM